MNRFLLGTGVRGFADTDMAVKFCRILHGMMKRVGNPVISDEVCVRVSVVFWWWIKIILSTNVTFGNVVVVGFV